MKYLADKHYLYDLIVKDEDGHLIYERSFGTDLSACLEKGEEFEKAHPTWSVRAWHRRVLYQEVGPQ